MTDDTDDLDRIDEETLTYAVSDEALEAAASGRDTAVTGMTVWLGDRRDFCC